MPDPFRRAALEVDGRHGSCLSCWHPKARKRWRGRAARARLRRELRTIPKEVSP
jgi:hypothetical protein